MSIVNSPCGSSRLHCGVFAVCHSLTVAETGPDRLCGPDWKWRRRSFPARCCGAGQSLPVAGESWIGGRSYRHGRAQRPAEVRWPSRRLWQPGGIQSQGRQRSVGLDPQPLAYREVAIAVVRPRKRFRHSNGANQHYPARARNALGTITPIPESQQKMFLHTEGRGHFPVNGEDCMKRFGICVLAVVVTGVLSACVSITRGTGGGGGPGNPHNARWGHGIHNQWSWLQKHPLRTEN